MGDLGDPKDVPALLALLAPGFIILWFRTRVVEGTTPDFKQQLLYFALVSAAYYAVATPLFDIERGVTLPGWAWSLLFYFFVPVLLGIAVGRGTQRGTEYKIAGKLGMRFSHRIPTAWDYRFSDISTDTYVLATLKDGTTVAGRMKEGSFAASAKDGRDLYVAELWDITEAGDWTPADPARGMLLCGDDIRYVEFFGGE
jgi:hypothetical protein